MSWIRVQGVCFKASEKRFECGIYRLGLVSSFKIGGLELGFPIRNEAFIYLDSDMHQAAVSSMKLHRVALRVGGCIKV